MDVRARDEKFAAKKLGVQVQTLRNWRHLRKGPPYLKLGGRAVRYLDADLEAFLKLNRIDPEAP